MEVKKGAVVISKAGHDKGDFQVIMDFDDTYAYVCDGKYRPLERLKKKKLIILQTNPISKLYILFICFSITNYYIFKQTQDYSYNSKSQGITI